MTTFEDAKVGDEVFDIKHGWGLVSKVFTKNMRPLTVQFRHTSRSYMFSGKYSETDKNQVLFWDEVTIIAPEKPLPKLEVDTKVLVWDYPSREPTRGYFSHFSKNGKIATFSLGRTSWSIENEPTLTWEYWELAKD